MSKNTIQFAALIISTIFQVRALALPMPQEHMDLDMSSRELSRVLKNRGYTYLMSGPMDPVVAMGQRNIQWLDYMNQARDAAHKLHMTKRGSLIAIPIESPRIYNQEIVLADYDLALQQMPAEMKAVIINGQPLSQNPPIDEATYLAWAFKIDRIYQLGIRFMLMEPYLDYMVSRQKKDIRGIYYLSKDADLQNTLAGFNNFPEEKKAQYRDWLLTMCHNDLGLAGGCEGDLNAAETRGNLFAYFQKHKTAAQNTWNEYFSMPATRSDVVWTQSNPGTMSVPFLMPNDSRIFSFLKDNIQDEWRNSSWNLLLDFKKDGNLDTTPHVVFEPGITPNVNELAGNIITMDQNSSVDEWDVQWTIRHEFGHVLGFVDCYLEYYDQNKKVIVGYQLDITNLMCSRRGVFQSLHFNQLKDAYYK